MKLKAKFPACGRLAPFSRFCENLMTVDPVVITNDNGCWTNEWQAGLLSHASSFELNSQRYQRLFHEFYKTIVRHQVRKIAWFMSYNEILVVLFEISECALMKANDDDHYFTERALWYNERLFGLADKLFMPFWFKNRQKSSISQNILIIDMGATG